MLNGLKNYLQSNFKEDADRRVLWLPVLFGVGIALYFALKVEPSKWLTLGLIEGLIVLAVIFRRRIGVLRFLLVPAFVLAGFTVIQIKAIYLHLPPQNIPADTFYFKGRIAAQDTSYQGRRRFVLDGLTDFEGHKFKGLYRVTQRTNKGKVKVGQCVEMIGTITPLAQEVLAGGYQFDRKGYFAGLNGSGFAESRWFVIPCEKEPAFDLGVFVANMRQKIVARIKKILPPDEAAVTAAIVAGEQSAVGERLYTNYRNAGLAHFLSISGLHMSMLAGLMFFLVRFTLACFPAVALRFDTKKTAAVFAIVISLVYLFIAGLAVPAQRAFIMNLVVLIGIMADRRALSIQTIALAAFLVLLIEPEVLVSASFQMSFAAVLGLIVFYEKTARRISAFLHVEGMRKWLRAVWLYVLGVVVSDFVASLMTLPFAVYHFNMVAIYTTLGNFLAGPVIGLIIMPFVLLSLLLMPLGLDVWFLKVEGFGVYLVNEITARVAALPNAGWQVPSMPHWGLMLIVLGGLWLMLWQAGWRLWGWIGIIAGALSIFWVQVPDVLLSSDLKAIAFKNSEGRLEEVASRGGRFAKSVWRNKYPFAEHKTKLKEHSEVKIRGSIVKIGTQSYDIRQTLGLSVYYKADGSAKIESIRDDIGHRLWNE